MKRIGFATVVAFVAVVGLEGAARAATLGITTDQPTYLVGETITVTVSGDSQGGSDNIIFGQLLYSGALTDTVGANQTALISGGLPWTALPLATGEGASEVFDQTRLLGAATVSNPLSATLTLTAVGLGTVNLDWNTATLDFFGLTSASGTSFTITPEPGTALLVVLGLAGIAFVGRRRA